MASDAILNLEDKKQICVSFCNNFYAKLVDSSRNCAF